MENIKINAELIITLTSKNDWINRIPRCLPEKQYYKEEFLWVDSDGNKMVQDSDFMAAEVMCTYPVKVYRFITASQEVERQNDLVNKGR